MFNVINLERRSDRKLEFIKRFKETGLQTSELQFETAIDGNNNLNLNLNLNLVDSSDYQNPRITGCIISHFNIWYKIATGVEDYGVVMEDDIHFHPHFKKNWLKIKQKLKNFKNKELIIYLGMGDFIPIHTKPPTETLLRALEKSHIKDSNKEIFGLPNYNSPYIKDGAFSYILTKQAAEKLINCKHKINKPINLWLKEFGGTKYVSSPLLNFHSSYELNVYDSDTMGIIKPLHLYTINPKKYSTAFLINIKEGVENNLIETVTTILANSDNPENVFFGIRIGYNLEIESEIKELRKILTKRLCLTIGPEKDCLETYEDINKLRMCFPMVDFFTVWEDSKLLITKGWDTILFKYYEIHDKPSFACFQIQSNIERDVNALNKENIKTSVWDFATPFLTAKLLLNINCVSPIPDINNYLKYVCYMTRITIFLKEIQTKKINNNNSLDIVKLENDFYHNTNHKYFINKAINSIINHSDYKACGLWINKPNNWDTTNTIVESKV